MSGPPVNKTHFWDNPATQYLSAGSKEEVIGAEVVRHVENIVSDVYYANVQKQREEVDAKRESRRKDDEARKNCEDMMKDMSRPSHAHFRG